MVTDTQVQRRGNGADRSARLPENVLLRGESSEEAADRRSRWCDESGPFCFVFLYFFGLRCCIYITSVDREGLRVLGLRCLLIGWKSLIVCHVTTCHYAHQSLIFK